MAVVQPIPVPGAVRPADKARSANAPITAAAVSVPKFRRCTFRRVEATTMSRALPVYDVQCLYPDRVTPLPLGDLAAAHPVCASCTNQGLFRPDAD